MVKNQQKDPLSSLQAEGTPFETFFFKAKKVGINWRLLSAVDVDEIQRTNNARELQPLIENITCGNILLGYIC